MITLTRSSTFAAPFLKHVPPLSLLFPPRFRRTSFGGRSDGDPLDEMTVADDDVMSEEDSQKGVRGGLFPYSVPIH